jgi:hypothetical protein
MLVYAAPQTYRIVLTNYQGRAILNNSTFVTFSEPDPVNHSVTNISASVMNNTTNVMYFGFGYSLDNRPIFLGSRAIKTDPGITNILIGPGLDPTTTGVVAYTLSSNVTYSTAPGRIRCSDGTTRPGIYIINTNVVGAVDAFLTVTAGYK